MKTVNRLMIDILEKNGIKASVKYIYNGSMAPCWRFIPKPNKFAGWTKEQLQTFRDLGFNGWDGDKPKAADIFFRNKTIEKFGLMNLVDFYKKVGLNDISAHLKFSVI